MSKGEISECFSKLEVYKTIFMDGQLLTRFEIPPPTTNITDYKAMFVCERIFRKLKKALDLDLQHSSDLPMREPTAANPL